MIEQLCLQNKKNEALGKRDNDD